VWEPVTLLVEAEWAAELVVSTDVSSDFVLLHLSLAIKRDTTTAR
jgi:hypothetical protein